MIIFSEHNVLEDPPFSRLDLISCRNLLIYLNPVLQQRLLHLFRYALNPKGLLFLGNAESVGEFDKMFTTLSRKGKLYQNKANINLNPAKNATFYIPSCTAGIYPGL